MLKKSKKSYSVIVQCNLKKTKKSIGVRMGKGKGKTSETVAFAKKNSVLFEFNNIDIKTLNQLVYKIRYKLSTPIHWKYSS